MALGALGFALFITLAFAGVTAVFMFPSLDPGVRWVLLSLFWWGAAFWTGVSLVSVAPKHGMAACLTLAVTGEAMFLAFRLIFVWIQAPNAWSSLLFASALFAAAPLLAGGAIVRRLTMWPRD